MPQRSNAQVLLMLSLLMSVSACQFLFPFDSNKNSDLGNNLPVDDKGILKDKTTNYDKEILRDGSQQQDGLRPQDNNIFEDKTPVLDVKIPKDAANLDIKKDDILNQKDQAISKDLDAGKDIKLDADLVVKNDSAPTDLFTNKDLPKDLFTVVDQVFPVDMVISTDKISPQCSPLPCFKPGSENTSAVQTSPCKTQMVFAFTCGNDELNDSWNYCQCGTSTASPSLTINPPSGAAGSSRRIILRLPNSSAVAASDIELKVGTVCKGKSLTTCGYQCNIVGGPSDSKLLVWDVAITQGTYAVTLYLGGSNSCYSNYTSYEKITTQLIVP